MYRTLEEAAELATPVPWSVDEVDIAATGILGNDGTHVFQTRKWLDDMALAAHCVSRFTHLVAALEKRLSECYHDDYCRKHIASSCPCTCSVGVHRILLDDAKRVKTG